MPEKTMMFGALLVLLIGAAARGQIDRRVQYNQPVPGQARDANPMIGSGGFNTALPGYTVNSANAIVTGNVRGLGGFHQVTPLGVSGIGAGLGANPFNVTGVGGLGASTVYDANLFRTNLPSAGLSYFDRRSYSVGDSINAPPGASGYYYAPAETVVPIGGIERGLTAPGSSAPRSPDSLVPPGGGTVSGYVPLPTGVADPLDRRVQSATPLNQPLGDRPLHGYYPSGSDPALQRPYLGAAQSPLFGPSPWDVRPAPELSARMYEAVAGGAPATDPLSTDRPGRAGITPDQTAESERIAAGPPAFPQESVPLPGLLPAAQPSVAAPGAPAVGAGTAGVPGLAAADSTAAGADRGADRYADLYAAVVQAQAVDPVFRDYVRSGRTGLLMPGRIDSRQPSVEDAASLRKTPSEQARDRFFERLDQAAHWARDLLDQPLTTFAGSGDSAANRYLRQAEDALHAGEYYTAAGLFAMAASVEPQNPLPRLGQGHALAAAGNYSSAVNQIVRGIALFPDIVAFNLDLVALVGRKDVFDVRRADLESQLSKIDSYELRFLLGYLEYYSGLREVGLDNLRAAATKAPPDSIIARFPTMLVASPDESAGRQP